ncbi:M20/M25/M40 family metallo-hydrolase [Arthrobacter sp. MDT1-48-3]
MEPVSAVPDCKKGVTAQVSSESARSEVTSSEALHEVVDICRELIRRDTSNYGSADGPGERTAAEYVSELLASAGLDPVILEAETRRSNVMARMAGTSRDALLVHGHLDVVPADRSQWSVDPFAGEIRDGFLWGRGAIDMKHMVAMILACVRHMHRTGTKSRRDLVLAFLADEENGFTLGSRFISTQHRHWLDGCSEAISEVGGFSIDLPANRRAYLIETGRKGVAWLQLTATGRAGHASITNPRSAIGTLAGAVERIAAHTWPVQLSPTTESMVRDLEDLTGENIADQNIAGGTLADEGPRPGSVLTPVMDMLTSSLRHVANPTVLRAGASINVVPGSAEALVDGRFLHGHETEFLDQIAHLTGPDIRIDVLDLTPSDQSDAFAPITTQMREALAAEDPGARIIPYSSSASTDNATFAGLGIQGYGFAPLQLPAGYNFSAMFHGVDEKVPVDGLRFGARVLYRFLTGVEP